jgi:hypothetical protein
MPTLSVLLISLLFQTAESPQVRAGMTVSARLETLIDSSTAIPGDTVVARVAEPVRVADKIIIPQGSVLNGRVETVVPATDAAEGRLRLVFREIQFSDGRRISTWITDSFSASPPKRKLRYVLFTGLGATAGSLIGGRAARVSGILGGTLVGYLIAANSSDGNRPDLKLKPGRVLHLKFGEDLIIRGQ